MIFLIQDQKLSNLDQELQTTRSDLDKLKSSKSQSTETTTDDATLQIISQLEERLQDLSQEYKSLTATIQGCQTKYLTIEDQVQIMYVTPLPFLKYSLFTELCNQLALGVFQILKALDETYQNTHPLTLMPSL